jgi:hypothetical protein
MALKNRLFFNKNNRLFKKFFYVSIDNDTVFLSRFSNVFQAIFSFFFAEKSCPSVKIMAAY